MLDAKTPAGVRRVDIHDDLQEEFAAYKAACGDVAAGQAGVPEHAGQTLDAQRDRAARDPARRLKKPTASGRRAGCPQCASRSRRTRCATRASRPLFAAGADQDYVAAQVGHDHITTTSRIYRYVLQRCRRGEIGRRRQLAMRESAASLGSSERVPDNVERRQERPEKAGERCESSEACERREACDDRCDFWRVFRALGRFESGP